MISKIKQFTIVHIYPIFYLARIPAGISLLSVLLFFSIAYLLKKTDIISVDVHKILPTSSILVLEIENSAESWSKMINFIPSNTFTSQMDREWSEIKSLTRQDSILSQIINQKKIYHLWTAKGSNQHDMMWIVPQYKFSLLNLFKTIKTEIVDQSTYLKKDIYRTSSGFYFSKNGGHLLISKNISPIENSLAAFETGIHLQKDPLKREKPNDNLILSCQINFELLSFLLFSDCKNASTILSDLNRQWKIVSFQVTEIGKDWHLNGFVHNKNAVEPYETSFFSQIPIPLSRIAFIQNHSLIRQKTSESDFNETFKEWILPVFYEIQLQSTSINTHEDKLLILPANNPILADKKLHLSARKYGILKEKEQDGHHFYQIKNAKIFDPVLGNHLKDLKQSAFTIDGPFVIIASDFEHLSLWLKWKKEKQSRQWQLAYPFLLEPKSFAGIFVPNHMGKWLDHHFCKAEFKSFLYNFAPLSFQSSYYSKDGYTFTMNISKSKSEQYQIEKLWEYKVDKSNLQGLFITQLNNNRLIVTQDQKDTLYAIYPDGKTAFKIKLDGKLQSDLKWIHIYQNEENYLCFNTDKTIWILDKNGKTERKIILAYKTSQPVTAIDSLDELQYFITCDNNKTYGYDKNGKPLAGWNPLAKSIKFQKSSLQSIRVQDKKCFAVADLNEKLYLFDIQGRNIKTFTIPNQISTIYQLKNKLWLTDQEGNCFYLKDNASLVRVLDATYKQDARTLFFEKENQCILVRNYANKFRFYNISEKAKEISQFQGGCKTCSYHFMPDKISGNHLLISINKDKQEFIFYSLDGKEKYKSPNIDLKNYQFWGTGDNKEIYFLQHNKQKINAFKISQ